MVSMDPANVVYASSFSKTVCPGIRVGYLVGSEELIAQITKLALVALALVTALIVATTYWQTWAAAGLADRQDNSIQRVAQFTIRRGNGDINSSLTVYFTVGGTATADEDYSLSGSASIPARCGSARATPTWPPTAGGPSPAAPL